MASCAHNRRAAVGGMSTWEHDVCRQDEWTVRLLVCAMSVWALRTGDLNTHEQVRCIYYMLGGVAPRAEGGSVRQCSHLLGPVDNYGGVVLEPILSLAMDTLLRLEGFFRAMPRNLERSPQGMFGAHASNVSGRLVCSSSR